MICGVMKNLFLLCSLFEEDSDNCPEKLLRYGKGLHIFSGIRNLEHAINGESSIRSIEILFLVIPRLRQK